MLVLTRKEGQKILINKGIIMVKVLRVQGGIVSIGIDASEYIDIAREEVFSQNLAQEKLASLSRGVR